MVNVRKSVDLQRIFLALLLTTLVFMIGITIGYVIRDIIKSSTIELENRLNTEFINLETIKMLEEDYPCEYYALEKSSEKLDYLGNLISILEEKQGFDEPNVMELKKFYTILEARHYLFVREKNSKCQTNFTTILFFYSNEKECKDEVDRISFILSYLRKKHSSLKIYSFDQKIDSDIVTMLKLIYNIEGCAKVVINEERIQEEITNYESVERFF